MPTQQRTSPSPPLPLHHKVEEFQKTQDVKVMDIIQQNPCIVTNAEPVSCQCRFTPEEARVP